MGEDRAYVLNPIAANYLRTQEMSVCLCSGRRPDPENDIDRDSDTFFPLTKIQF